MNNATKMDTDEPEVDFNSMNLDDRILKAIRELSWGKPTLVQEKFIPLALEGKDILARARTGSGKTAAFSIPVLQGILESKEEVKEQCISALILTPSKELARQVHSHLLELCRYCSREIAILDLASQADIKAERVLLTDCPDIVVGTPSRVLAHLKAENLILKKSLRYLVVDEADLVFSFGYEEDTKELVRYLPKIYQAFLTSATLSEEVKSLKKLLLHNAFTLKLEESQLPGSNQLTQYHIKCDEQDKFVLIYALYKLGLIRGKTIIFVKTTDRCYRLKLFLQQFGIRSCVFNAQLPVNSRCHIVDQFDKGKFYNIIATDESSLMDEEAQPTTSADNEAEEGTAEPEKKKKKRSKADKESGVSRGIDFHLVSNVVNFDFPRTVENYIHRVGRTARGWNKGTALSFAAPDEVPVLEAVAQILMEQIGENAIRPYQFRMEELDGFRYRATDVLRAVTSSVVREARLEEIKGEIMKSRQLKSFFAKNPRDFDLIRHDKNLRSLRKQDHLRDIPEYIVPPALRGSSLAGVNRALESKGKKRKQKSSLKYAGSKKFQKLKADPLRSFEFDGGD